MNERREAHHRERSEPDGLAATLDETRRICESLLGWRRKALEILVEHGAQSLLGWRRKALESLVEHGAQSPNEFAGRFYQDAPAWKRQENVGKAKKFLEDLRKRDLVKRCRRVCRYFISEEGKRFLLENQAWREEPLSRETR